MNDNELKWTIESRKELLHTPVFDVIEQQETSASGITGSYVAMEAPDWVQVIPVYGDSFVMVRQWRHSSEEITTEFPGGMVDKGEDPAISAVRELLEETGFQANKLTPLGSCSPNPALFKNRFHVFLAEELIPTGKQGLDDDEVLTYELIPIDTVIASYGAGEFSHALMGTALTYYLQRRYLQNKDII